MTIVKTATQDGVTIGFDDESGEWVPIDTGYQRGTFFGNLARGAADETGRIGVGLRSLVDNSELMGQELKVSQEELAAQERSAPWARVIGGTAPDIAAGLGVGYLTAGLGLPAMLAGEAGIGALMGGARPGSLEERAQNALWGAGFNAAGAGVLTAAERGIAKGFEVARGILAKSSAATARGIEHARVQGEVTQAAREAELSGNLNRVDQDAGLAPGSEPGAQNPAVDPQGVNGPRSVGAAETPDELLPDDAADYWRSARNDMTSSQAKEFEAAEALGYKTPAFVGTSRGSVPRLTYAMNEMNPFADTVEKLNAEANETLKSRAMGKALGLADNLDNGLDAVTVSDLDAAQQLQAERYTHLQNQIMVPIRAGEFGDAVKPIKSNLTLLDDPDAERLLRGLEERAKGNDTQISPQEYMRTMRQLQDKGSMAAAKGDQTSSEMYFEAVQKFHEVIERSLTRAAEKMGSKDAKATATKLREQWAEMRRMTNLQRMLAGSGLARDGSVNSAALLRQMIKAPRNGGFGPKGPPESSRLRDLFVLIRADAAAKTMVPATGARLAGHIARQTAKGAGAAALGYAGFSGLSKLWD